VNPSSALAWQRHQRGIVESLLCNGKNLVPFVVNAVNATNGGTKGVSGEH